MGVDVAIVCSGESVRRFLDAPPRHDLCIGVNRMAGEAECNWWAFNDWQAFGDFTPQTRGGRLPGVFTSKATLGKIAERFAMPRVMEFQWLTVEELEPICSEQPGWKNFSMLMAWVLAAHLGAERITLYGCDWKGTNDWDGRPSPRGGRSGYRWNNELHKASHLASWLSRRGVAVRRLRVDGSFEEMNAMAKPKDEGNGKPGTVAGAQPPPAMTEHAARDPLGVVPSHVETVRLTAKRRVGDEELPAGAVLANVELFAGCTLNFLYRAGTDCLVTSAPAES